MKASLQIQTALKEGCNFLKSAYCTSPFKVADITEGDRSKSLRLMLMSASPGILDGDAYDIKIEVGEKASLHLETQSYQRLFPMPAGASQHTKIHMQRGSRFSFLPHPVVPHRGSSFFNHTKIFVSENCTLLWGEVLTPGRQLYGEKFTFSKYHSLTEIFLKNKLAVKENLLLQPALQPLYGIGQLEGFTHQATLLYIAETALMEDKREEAKEWLRQQDAITFGISMLPVNGLVVRILGKSGEQLHQALKRIAALFTTVTTPEAVH